jgi:ABC-2 type transport system permease protein
MNRAMIQRLVLKDWYMHRWLVGCCVAGGALALIVFQMGILAPDTDGGGSLLGGVGIVAFFVALIMLANFAPGSNIVSERQNQTRPFVMSLPISGMEYATAKIVSTVGMFLVPWLAMIIVVLSIVAGSSLPDGLIPLTLFLVTVPFVGFCLMTGVAMVVESPGWSIAVTVFTNVSYSFVWLLVVTTPALTRDLSSPVAVWSPEVLTLLGAELGFIVLILASTFYLQSRKTDYL